MLFCSEMTPGDARLCIIIGPPNMYCLEIG